MAYTETDKYTAGVVRMVKALGKRVGQEDPHSIEHLQAVQAALDVAWRNAVHALREAGEPDHRIGARLGITRQAVQQRWPRTT
jgi:hypothetical protein